MKRTTALYVLAALAALSFASQALAKGGSMRGGQGHGATGGASQMVSTMQTASGNTMQQRNMSSNGALTGPAAGTGSQGMRQAGMGSSAGHQFGLMNGNGTAPTATQPSVSTAAD